MLKLQHKTWLDKAGVARAVTEGLKGKGMPSPLFRAAVDVQVTAQRSMKGGRRQHWWKAWTKWTTSSGVWAECGKASAARTPGANPAGRARRRTWTLAA